MDDNTNDRFLSRWSRLKRDANVAPSGTAAGHVAPANLAPSQPQDEADPAESPMPPLPPVEELTMDSDFSGFLHPKVAQSVRHAALKKLFSDPHFNVMDGLDIYIEDYSLPDPLPAELLAKMRSAQNIFGWARDELVEGEAAAAPTPAPVAVNAATASGSPLEQPHEPPVLRESTVPFIAAGDSAARSASPLPAAGVLQSDVNDNS